MRIIFAGTPEFALPCLEQLTASQHEIIAVYTQPDRPAGRGRKLQASCIKTYTQQQEIPVYQPARLNDEAQQTLQTLAPDLMIVVAYGLLLPETVLAIPSLGCINVHASILPRWRGAAPIARALLAGDKQTGVSIMQMEAGLDTGPVYNIATCAIENDDTSKSLHDRLATLGATTLIETLDQLSGLTPKIQDDSGSNYAKKLSKAEACLDWQLPAEELTRQVRGFNPWPIAHSYCQKNLIKIWEATVDPAAPDIECGTIIAIDEQGILVRCGQGSLRIQTLQLAGGKAMPANNLLNAPRAWLSTGAQLGPLTNE